MAETALERVLHYNCPEWGDSIKSARLEAGFSFKLQDQELWEWLVSGGHEKVKEIADREVNKLEIEEFYKYYLCCFYSDYERLGGIIDFEAIQGPPWLTLKCPATDFGEDWHRSILKARETIDHKLGQEDGLSNGKSSSEFLRWYFESGGADEVAELAMKEVQRLGMEAINSLLWVCCMSPTRVYQLVEKSGLLYNSFPQLMDWGSFSLTCPDRATIQRFRAYPGGIDWNERAKQSDKSSMLPIISGIDYKILSNPDSKLTLTVSWDPLTVTNTKDLSAAVRGLQKYYYEVMCKAGERENVPGILQKLTQQKRKGGRPRWGVAQDKLALEYVRLMDEEGLSEKEVIAQSKFDLQEDSYGNLSQSTTVRRYIRRGRKLLSLGHHYQQ